MKKVGIFAGSFDPFHQGHLDTALAAINEAKLDKVYILIEQHPRRKPDITSYKHRLAIAKLMVKNNKLVEILELADDQFTPARTLAKLLQHFPGSQLWLLMGDDWLEHLGNWKQVELLILSCRLVIVERFAARFWIEKKVDELMRQTGMRPRYTVVASPRPSVSATSVRQQLAQGTSPWLSAAAQRYVHQHQLYASDNKAAVE